MNSSRLIRWGTVGAAIAGVAWALSGAVAFVFAGEGPADPTGTLYFYLFEGAHAIAAAGMLAALLGFHVRQAPNYGRLGAVGFALAFVGTTGVCLSGVLWLVLLQEANTPLLRVVWSLALLCSFVGLPLLGVATFRAKVLPRWSGPLLIAYIPLLSVAVSFDGAGGMMLLFLVLVGVLWSALGYALWRRGDESAGSPPALRPPVVEPANL